MGPIQEFHSGYIAVVGKPNVGKSTLINALLHQKVAAVSPRPQTTRRRQLAILTLEAAQLVFIDTPGLHRPRHKLGEFLNQEADEAMKGIDVVLWLVDVHSEPSEEDMDVAARLNSLTPSTPLILAANKVDLADEGVCARNVGMYGALLKRDYRPIKISATRQDGLQELVSLLIASCPARPAEYDPDQITDLYEREIAADLIREAALLQLRDEVPHALAVRVDEFRERPNGISYIAVTLLVERESQKGIVIGERGKMLKRIGTNARREIESMTGRKVFLQMRVKVERDWRNDTASLHQLGYRLKT